MSTNFNDALQANMSFAVKQTTHIETEVYKIKYPSLDYASIIPVDYSANEWVKSVTYYSTDATGTARWINGNAKDVPTVSGTREKHETEVHTAAIGYDYGFEEVNQARLLGINLESDDAESARRAYEQMVYNTALLGDTDKGFEGIFSYTGVPAASVAADGTGSSTLWSTKSADLIIRDINALLIGIHTATKTVELADTLLLPVERWQTIASSRIPDTNMTILEFVEKSNVYTAQTGQPLMIRAQRGLIDAGAAGAARMIAYRRSPEVLKLHIPMAHRFLPVQIEGLQFVVPGVFRLGGLDIRLPKAVSYGDGI